MCHSLRVKNHASWDWRKTEKMNSLGLHEHDFNYFIKIDIQIACKGSFCDDDNVEHILAMICLADIQQIWDKHLLMIIYRNMNRNCHPCFIRCRNSFDMIDSFRLNSHIIKIISPFVNCCELAT